MHPFEVEIVHLRGGGVSVLIEIRVGDTPRVVHWGADLGEGVEASTAVLARRALANSAPAVDSGPGLIPQESTGFLGHPAVTGSRSGLEWSPRFVLADLERSPDAVVLTCVDELARLRISTSLAVASSGIVTVSHTITNESAEPYALEELAVILPAPLAASEVLDMAGRWSFERQPQRVRLETGTWLRELKHGRTGFDAPLVFALSTPRTTNRSGEIWAIHFAWSGNSRIWAERTAAGDQSLGAAELLGPGGELLGSGESYSTPTLFASWSSNGLDGVAARFHRHIRARAHHPRSPRPVTFNTWEAVYFDQGEEALISLAEAAAAFGVERFVLDDGWFKGRRDDSRGLGDWSVDSAIWPDGLDALADRVVELGMQFGIWVEPEMVNPDSDLFRSHPEWILHVPGRGRPLLWRNQYVLDLSRAEVRSYLFASLDRLLGSLPVSFLKWDHNRDVIDAGSEGGRHAVHSTTLGVYQLLDELRIRHPTVEIESCSSGGGRVDLAILERTDRVWASDSNDALDRHAIQRWTAMLLPPELVGSHIGPPTAHTTGRTHDLGFRVSAAMFGSLGIEWDIARASANETRGLTEAIEFYKRFRSLIHSGELVHADLPDPSASLEGVVAQDGTEALYRFSQLTSAPRAVPSPIRLPGVRDELTYRLKGIQLPGHSSPAQRTPPQWWEHGGIEASGRVLSQLGLAFPALRPEQSLFLHAFRV